MRPDVYINRIPRALGLVIVAPLSLPPPPGYYPASSPPLAAAAASPWRSSGRSVLCSALLFSRMPLSWDVVVGGGGGEVGVLSF